jgi:POT family proton-dependent oligopeptide transporter
MTNSNSSHPKGLYTLFFTEMWERFSYYGMRALLVLYLTAELLNNGFGMDRAEALAIYGIFTALVYVTPIFGGFLADKILGQRKAIFIGAIVMALGQFTLAWSVIAGEGMREFILHSGLALLIVGNGFFKPNISTVVGGLYSADDPRKDGGFTIFYMGINLGAFIAPLTAGALGEIIGWEYGFATAGLGMVLSTFWFYARRDTLGNVGLPPKKVNTPGYTDLVSKDWFDIIVYTVVSTVLSFGTIYLLNNLSESAISAIIWVLGIAGAVGIAYTIFKGTEGRTEWSRVAVIFVLAIFNIVFWSGFEQAGGTFNLFAAENTDRLVFGWEIPASYFQSINAIAIFTIAPIFDIMWVKLTNIGKNPPTPVKFGFALVMLSLGFFVMAVAASNSEGGMLVSPLWLVAVYLLHTLGELMISPIGLSMITKLSPTKIVSVMMGIWMGSIAIGNYLAAAMEAIAHSFGFQQGAEMFQFIGFQALIAGGIAILISPILKKAMKGIH